MNGDRGWFGWPTDDILHGMREEWAAAPDLSARQAVARRMQERPLGDRAADLSRQHVPLLRLAAQPDRVIAMPELVPFWNMEKTA